ncbi:MAG TPA: glycosyltransferase family 4 protein [Solirubrobacter sp.]|nr:glycosyltransferase family 4 protein [Solirubrobacter sp.]
MRILVCASEAPRAPLNGSRLVLYELCSRLARTESVTVVALRHPDQIGDPPEGIELIELPYASVGAIDRLTALVRREPVEARPLAAPFLRFLPGWLSSRSFDVAHAMLGSLALIAPALGALPAVIAPLDAWHRNVRAEAASASGLERAWRLTQERAVRRFEARAYRPYRGVVLVTESDAAALDPALPLATIPNGVDAAHFAPDGRPRAGILFTGALDAPANEQAALRLALGVLPRVREAIPDASLSLVGRSPGPRLRELDGVQVIADVPDLRPYLWGAAVYACPMVSGTGIKNKLLEALAAGAPAVATPLACQGLTVDGRIRVASDDAGLAAEIVALLRDRDAATRMAEAARAYVRGHHDWDAVAAAYHAVYERAIAA